MADTTKIEAMLESLVNEDKAKAEELFHEFVIEKSREIYEGLLENDLEELDIDESDDEDVDEATDEEVDESDEEVDESDEEVDESDEEVEESFDDFEMEADDEPDMGGDPADDMMGDLEGGDMDDEEGDDMGDMGDDDMEDRVVDLEDALDELKAEFEKMMAGEEGGDEEPAGDDMDMDMDDMDGKEEPEEEAMSFESDEEDDDEEVEESVKSPTEQMREYVEKVAGGHGAETKGKGESGANTKSPVAGKNDMGGTASNIVAGGEEGSGGTQGGLANPSSKEENAGNVNVPGGKASKSMKAQPKGHGAEKKGSGETGTNSKSLMGS